MNHIHLEIKKVYLFNQLPVLCPHHQIYQQPPIIFFPRRQTNTIDRCSQNLNGTWDIKGERLIHTVSVYMKQTQLSTVNSREIIHLLQKNGKKCRLVTLLTSVQLMVVTRYMPKNFVKYKDCFCTGILNAAMQDSVVVFCLITPLWLWAAKGGLIVGIKHKWRQKPFVKPVKVVTLPCTLLLSGFKLETQ